MGHFQFPHLHFQKLPPRTRSSTEHFGVFPNSLPFRGLWEEFSSQPFSVETHFLWRLGPVSISGRLCCLAALDGFSANYLENSLGSTKVEKLERQLALFFPKTMLRTTRAQLQKSKDLPLAFFDINLSSFEKRRDVMWHCKFHFCF